ncbi:hypothetical protein [Sphingobium sp. MK2]|uniref:hypothetical protein n=1 Tax=Sphingobium sp. MK2 TaxID=3116540 RepID=UPI0032E36510
MPVTYMGKAKVRIPSIATARDIACIVVDMTTWDGPLSPGRTGRDVTERLVLPIGHKGVAMGRVSACFDPETGAPRGNISSGVSGFHDAIGKRLSWGKEP